MLAEKPLDLELYTALIVLHEDRTLNGSLQT